MQEYETRRYGLTPRGLVAALAVAALVASIAAFALAAAAVGLLLLLAAVLLAALYLEQARRSRSTSLDRVAAGTVDQTRALAGFAGTSVRSWTRAGREVARLRLEARLLARERSQLQHALGGACYERDTARTDELRERMRVCDERIEACAARARGAVASARSRVSRERLAVAATQVRKPGE